ncbi:MAG: GNAT family N-acetyltransferase [Acidimicrobiia bacterium]
MGPVPTDLPTAKRISGGILRRCFAVGTAYLPTYGSRPRSKRRVDGTNRRLWAQPSSRRQCRYGAGGRPDRGASGEVEPVVVTDRLRSRGVGRLLIERVITEAVARGYEYRAIRPVARNVSAIQRFYDAGFQTLGGHVDLTIDLADRHHRWQEGARLHGLDFRY